MQKIGEIKMLRRYPVKSMAGEDLDEVFISYSGLMGDRVWAFVDEANKSNFPWMTAREQRELVLFKPRFVEPLASQKQYPRIEKYKVFVKTPDGAEFAIDDPALKKILEEKSGRKLYLRFSERGMQDARPVSIFSMDTLKVLEGELSINLDHRRFRANVYAKWGNGKAFYEDELIGKKLQIGEKCVLEISKKDPRCRIITIDPDTAEQEMNILSHVARAHENNLGVYAVVLREGIVRTGDIISLL